MEPAALVIAIDGPSGSGKSSVSRTVARRLGVGFLDTGATYRAVTWWCLERGLDLADRAAVAAAARDLPIRLGLDPDDVQVEVDGQTVTDVIRTTRISEAVSAVATNLDVRVILIDLQRRLIADAVERTGGCVAEGRDITTVVAPEAPIRILLTASESARLARRSAQVHGSADAADVAATRDQVVRRDAEDSTVADFTTAADGVTTIDTSDLDFDQSVAAVLSVVAARRLPSASREVRDGGR